MKLFFIILFLIADFVLAILGISKFKKYLQAKTDENDAAIYAQEIANPQKLTVYGLIQGNVDALRGLTWGQMIAKIKGGVV